MLAYEPGANVEAVLGIIAHAVHSGTISAEQFGEVIWSALGTGVSQRSPMFDWHWGRVADLVVEVDPPRFARLFITLFESDNTWLSTDSAQSALEHAMRVDPVAVWEVIGPALLRDDLTGVRIRVKLEHWFGDVVPSETLVEWAQRHGSRGFQLAAALLNAKGETLSPTARLLVKKSREPKEVLDRLLAGLQTGIFVGPMSSHLEGQLETLRNWAKDDDPRIRAWAEKTIAHAAKSVKRQKLIEEEGGMF
jgi:hypothetical protein